MRTTLMIATVCVLLLGAAPASGPADVTKEQMDAAYARLHKKEAAATQPAAITNAELTELRAELTLLRAENARLRAEKTAVNGGQAAASPADGRAVYGAKQGKARPIVERDKLEYDKFADVTTVSSALLNVDDHDDRLRVVARFTGKDITGKSPDLDLCLVIVYHGEDGELILLVDDVRFRLTVHSTSPAPLGDETFVSLVTVDAPTLQAMAVSKKIEGKVGRTEFKLDSAQIAAIAAFYKQVTPPQAGTPSSKAEP